MPLSSDPERRAAQLSNLKRGGNPPPPPAPQGHTRALVHGGYAAVAVERLDDRTLRVFDALALDAPLRGPDGELPAHDAGMVRLLAECLCRLDDVRDHLRDTGWRDAKTGEPRLAVLDLERRLRGEAAGYMDRLGMSPRARAALGLDLARTAQAVDAATALSERDPVLRRELMKRAGLPVPDGEVTP